MINAREMLNIIEEWLGWQEETLSFGLKNAFDALRLYDYWLTHEAKLGEMADEWEPENRIAALGYDPMDGAIHESKTTGADQVVKAMNTARKLLDSVAFVTKQGDTKELIKLIDIVLSIK